MNEPLPSQDIKAGVPPMQAAEEGIAYRPISGWAVAGFSAGAVFTLLVLVCTVVAIWQGAPMFFPLWIVGLAVSGAVLSFLGLRQVQNSEGTRAGGKLARIGLWLSIISGLCYLSYYFSTGLAIEGQADDFLLVKSDDDSGFFPVLREGATDPVQLNHAFLLTLPANQRSVRPDNEEALSKLFDSPSKENTPGNLSLFRNGISLNLNGVLPCIFFKQNAKDVKIEAGPVEAWAHEQKSYKVRRKYHLESKEVILEMSLLVCSSEAEAAGEGRKWYLSMPHSVVTSKRLTRYGEGLAVLRQQARRTFESWIATLNQGRDFGRISEYDKTDWDGVRTDLRNKRTTIRQLFEAKTPGRIERFQLLNGADLGKWEESNGKIRIYQAFRFTLPKDPGVSPGYIVDAYVGYETERDNVNPAEISLESRPVSWNLVRIVFTNIMPVAERKAGP